MPEEWLHSTYFRDLAGQAGIPTRALDLSELGWDGMLFRDTEGGEVTCPPECIHSDGESSALMADG
jgi:hypothetical protein